MIVNGLQYAYDLFCINLINTLPFNFLGVVPVFYFILPLYSFYHMDDFSWGTTRQVGQSQTLTRQRAVRNLDVMSNDTETSRYEEIDFTNEPDLDDNLKEMFTRVRVR